MRQHWQVSIQILMKHKLFADTYKSLVSVQCGAMDYFWSMPADMISLYSHFMFTKYPSDGHLPPV